MLIAVIIMGILILFMTITIFFQYLIMSCQKDNIKYYKKMYDMKNKICESYKEEKELSDQIIKVQDDMILIYKALSRERN